MEWSEIPWLVAGVALLAAWGLGLVTTLCASRIVQIGLVIAVGLMLLS